MCHLRAQAGRKATAVQTTAAPITLDKGLQACLAAQMSTDRGIQVLAAIPNSSDKSTQVISVRDSLATPWCRSWLARMLRRGQRRYLLRAWCAWTRQYVERRLAKALNDRLGSRLQSVRSRSARSYLKIWSQHCLQERLLRALQVRQTNAQVIGRGLCRLAMPSPFMQRAVLQSWRGMRKATPALRCAFRRWYLYTSRNRSMQFVQGLVRHQAASSQAQTCFNGWKAMLTMTCVERQIQSSQRACLASCGLLDKFHSRALLSKALLQWQRLAAEASARTRFSLLWERGLAPRRAEQVSCPFLAWKLLLTGKRLLSSKKLSTVAAQQDPLHVGTRFALHCLLECIATSNPLPPGELETPAPLLPLAASSETPSNCAWGSETCGWSC